MPKIRLELDQDHLAQLRHYLEDVPRTIAREPWRDGVLLACKEADNAPYVTEEDLADVAPPEEMKARHARAAAELAHVHKPTEPDLLDLLGKLASGEGGRRTGELLRRGWIKVEVTMFGRAALGLPAPKPSPVPEGDIKCTICTQALGMNEAIIGDGDGTGRRFAHASCYRRRAAETAERDAAQGLKILCPKCEMVIRTAGQACENCGAP